MPDSLFDALSAIEPTEEDALPEESEYLEDENYHQRAYMIEQALRDEGVLDQPTLPRDKMPYDKDLRDLIMAVTTE